MNLLSRGGGEGEGVVWAVSQPLELELSNFKDLVEMLTFMEENSQLWPWGQRIPETGRQIKTTVYFKC